MGPYTNGPKNVARCVSPASAGVDPRAWSGGGSRFRARWPVVRPDHHGRTGHRGAQRHPRHMMNAHGRVAPPGHGRPSGERGMVTARYGKKGENTVRHISPGAGWLLGPRSRTGYGLRQQAPPGGVVAERRRASDPGSHRGFATADPSIDWPRVHIGDQATGLRQQAAPSRDRRPLHLRTPIADPQPPTPDPRTANRDNLAPIPDSRFPIPDPRPRPLLLTLVPRPSTLYPRSSRRDADGTPRTASARL
jgi:hypothetical protein